MQGLLRRHGDDVDWLAVAAAQAARRGAHATHATLGARLIALGDKRGEHELDRVFRRLDRLRRPWDPSHLRADRRPEVLAMRSIVAPWANELAMVNTGLFDAMGIADLWVRLVSIAYRESWHGRAMPAGLADAHERDREKWRAAWRAAHWISQHSTCGTWRWQSPLIDGVWTDANGGRSMTSIRLEVSTCSRAVWVWPSETQARPITLPRMPRCI